MKPFRAELAAALVTPGLKAEAIVAEGVAAGYCRVLNRHVVSPGGLRYATADEMAWLDPDDPPTEGMWLLGSGILSLVG